MLGSIGGTEHCEVKILRGKQRLHFLNLDVRDKIHTLIVIGGYARRNCVFPIMLCALIGLFFLMGYDFKIRNIILFK
jgi:hypothetical protein